MAKEIANIFVYRMIAIQNLKHDLLNGLYCKNKCVENPKYKTIGNKEIITQRDKASIKCYPEYVVNDFVPFYFSVRTPMLFNIKTGRGVPALPQDDIIYLCFRLIDLTTNEFTWCYTNGNAAKAITKFFNTLENIDTNIDWRSIETTDFRDDNADGDEDRVRKKHAEFLVHEFVPIEKIKGIVVYSQYKMEEVNGILNELDLNIPVKVNPNNKYYF